MIDFKQRPSLKILSFYFLAVAFGFAVLYACNTHIRRWIYIWLDIYGYTWLIVWIVTFGNSVGVYATLCIPGSGGV